MCSDNTHEKKPYIITGNDIHYPGQTNHDACFIPEGVRQYAGEPLYILVAHWCLQQQDWVQRNQISEAFHITARRASYLIAYLRSKTSRVVSVCRHQTLTNKARRYEIYVTRVLEAPATARRGNMASLTVSRRRVGNADTAQANELWNRLRRCNRAGRVLKEGDEDDCM
ncbi:CaiF/GrlA family transcriptional regulator [Salmonella enterica subsp. enterica serovar Newport]|uniref:CaiF/GrlA family transcriptional regulator n=1 Tax=Salmonella newport TaxID=108619 RepID=A0A5W8IWR5_SALNE|nr:CaiF/GrlA family transcriptional regulator [Salmonella enterica subsp. enterica serovar Newport]EBQ9422323.1 CaiF/GrlA family transcriptional regulator [Salmonella enterica subsp. enterica serovar Newport]EBS1164824.1 CaiF/GrlA family transcriptional regulator [Salmonella enterica subsp. enterica serovar Newport]EBS6022081.1 CaiF/GrlA family transcriptional regulator [Salmonella enterica subsp. enterica serovar Newport]EBU8125270.1 CaiF/GrlA family transcriptional regulator [Salmonella enter